MSKARSEFANWENRLRVIRACHSVADLVKEHGEPLHKARHNELDIWHYPLGSLMGTIYSIHVAITEGQISQAYFHLEPI